MSAKPIAGQHETGKGIYLGGAFCGGELVVWAAAELVDEFWTGDYK